MAGASGRTVVIAVDEHPHSKAAFEWFLDNVYRKEDLVVICHVPEAPSLPTFSFKSGIAPPVDEWQKAMTDQLDKIKRLEQDYEVDLITKKIKFKIWFEQAKSPGIGITSIAEKENADLVVVGTRGLDPIQRVFMGSVSEYVVNHADIPVLVCPLSKKMDE